MKILLYGGGAVGLGLAGALIKSGAEVTIIARPEAVAALRKDGLFREGIFGAFHAPPDSFQAFTRIEDTTAAPYDIILVCTKSYDSISAAEDIAHCPWLTHQRTKIVLCQNGWGNAEFFLAFFKPEILFNARIITGFQRSAPNRVNITVHVDDIRIGSRFNGDLASVEPLCAGLTAGDIPCVPVTEIVKDLWAKMLYNCALNPLGAIFRVTYGELGNSIHTRQIMERIIHEIFAVLEKSGYKTHWEKPEAYLDLFFQQLIPATAKHEASTLQDIRAGKRTEIDALNGAVIELGESLEVDVTVNRQIYHMIKFIESRLGLSENG